MLTKNQEFHSRHGALSASDNWLTQTCKNSFAPLQLFCFSYAGGGASLFSDWGKCLADYVEVFAVQLPGRENRFSEKLMSSMDEIVEHVSFHIHKAADRPFILFGHSLGALLAYETALALSNQYAHSPEQLIVSGKQSLCSTPRRKKICDLSESGFIEELRRYGGTPEEVLQNDELRSLVLPILRADITIFDRYSPATKPKLNCPIAAFGASDDPYVFPEDLQGWASATNSEFNSYVFNGDHFFINGNDRQSVFNTIKLIANGLCSGGVTHFSSVSDKNYKQY